MCHVFKFVFPCHCVGERSYTVKERKLNSRGKGTAINSLPYI
jgi:hypothetical protein